MNNSKGNTPITPSGIQVPLPPRNFTPISPRPGIAGGSDPENSTSGIYYNPFGNGGGSAAPDSAPTKLPTNVGGYRIYGGKTDLLPSIATRGISIGMLMNLLNRDDAAEGEALNERYGEYTQQQGGGLLSEAFQNISPDLTTNRMLSNQDNQTALTELLNKNYQLGGDLWGSEVGNTGSASQIYNAAQRAKYERSAWWKGVPFVGPLLKGITDTAIQ